MGLLRLVPGAISCRVRNDLRWAETRIAYCVLRLLYWPLLWYYASYLPYLSYYHYHTAYPSYVRKPSRWHTHLSPNRWRFEKPTMVRLPLFPIRFSALVLDLLDSTGMPLRHQWSQNPSPSSRVHDWSSTTAIANTRPANGSWLMAYGSPLASVPQRQYVISSSK